MAVLFDLDGTLINPQQGIVSAIRFALGELGHPIPDEDALLGWIGPPLGDSFSAELKLPPHAPQIAEAIRLFRVYYGKTGVTEANVFDGIEEMLATLKAEGQSLYIATSKPTIYAKRIAEHFRFGHYFAGIYGSEMDKLHSGKTELLLRMMAVESLLPTACTMVGDRKYDVGAALACGIRPIGVLWGFGDYEELQAAGAGHIVTTISELTKLLSMA